MILPFLVYTSRCGVLKVCWRLAWRAYKSIFQREKVNMYFIWNWWRVLCKYKFKSSLRLHKLKIFSGLALRMSSSYFKFVNFNM